MITPAATYPKVRDAVRLLLVDVAARRCSSRAMGELPELLRAGDLLVVNDAATLPSSFRGHDERGRELEVRLLSWLGASRFRALLFGSGDWRMRTEHRPAPPEQRAGQRLRLGRLTPRVERRGELSARVYDLDFELPAAELWPALYAEGRPVQYSHLAHELPLWAVQNVFASRPWAFEMPSAGRPLSWALLQRLQARGIRWAALTHAAGLSATGDAELDAALPLPERYELPSTTVEAIARARDGGGRVIAVGTSVVRALEGNLVQYGQLRAGVGETDLRLDESYHPRLVSGLLSGIHTPGESHFDLLRSFAPAPLLEAALQDAALRGYRSHELGDAMLVLAGR